MARDHFKTILEKCGGLQRLDAAIYDLLVHVQTRVAGGLLYNWFKIGFWSNGALGIQCVTCNKDRILTFGNCGHAFSTSPFNNFTTTHLPGEKHDEACTAAISLLVRVVGVLCTSVRLLCVYVCMCACVHACAEYMR